MLGSTRRHDTRHVWICLVGLALIGAYVLGGCPGPDPTDPGTNPPSQPGTNPTDPGTNPPSDPGGGGGSAPAASTTGTWSGTITYTASLVLSGSPGGSPIVVDAPTTVTFDADGVPNVVGIYLGSGQEAWELQTDGLRNVGDQAVFNFASGGTTTTITATVTSVSSSTTAYSISLDLQVEFSTDPSGPKTGTYTATATLQSDGTILWQSHTDLDLSGQVQLAVSVDAQGTLTKQ